MIAYEQVVETVHISSAKELFEVLSPFDDRYNLLNNGYIFRGVASTMHFLLPTALRPENFEYIKSFSNLSKFIIQDGKDYNTEFFQRFFEYGILYDFFVNSDSNGLKIPHVDALRNSIGMYYKEMSMIYEEWLPKELHELAALAQHYGLPTRLLDWSSDPFVSLYFASINSLKQNNDSDEYMVLWAMNRYRIEFESVTETYSQLEIINPPYGGNDNLRSQKGILTYWRGDELLNPDGSINFEIGIDRRPLDELLQESLSENERYLKEPFKIFYKFLIPNKEARAIFIALEKMNYNAARLFPGFDGIAMLMRERLLTKV
ncbi:hypothetical protein BK131_03575 [Paenibacillus amylolyticus]|uniref:FRG domain-containing protein n=1 Tax=Paenibacillus amylolyticus TaxID=1451 RepID=A0A1R1C4Q2_PAEAM|nr:FRG domain-containing protein [Paenibacillus amylolyticus]OMF17064.1 hypothetical protein BK131_03575 [Paenibacillus amylolyticus]